MSTPWIMGIVNEDKSVSAVAIRHDGYIDNIKYWAKTLNTDNVRRIVDYPLVEIEGLHTTYFAKWMIQEYPEFEKQENYKKIGDTKYCIGLPDDWGDKNKRNIWTSADFVEQDKLEDKQFKDVLDFADNAGRLEGWHHLLLLDNNVWKHIERDFNHTKQKPFKPLCKVVDKPVWAYEVQIKEEFISEYYDVMADVYDNVWAYKDYRDELNNNLLSYNDFIKGDVEVLFDEVCGYDELPDRATAWKMLKTIVELENSAEFYKNNDMNSRKLQLSDRQVLFAVTFNQKMNDSDLEQFYYGCVDKALDSVAQRFDLEDIGGYGRSGRHICIDDNFENLVRFNLELLNCKYEVIESNFIKAINTNGVEKVYDELLAGNDDFLFKGVPGLPEMQRLSAKGSISKKQSQTQNATDRAKATSEAKDVDKQDKTPVIDKSDRGL